MENILTVVAAGNNVIKSTRNLDPKFPRHMLEIISGSSKYRRIADLAPCPWHRAHDASDIKDDLDDADQNRKNTIMVYEACLK